MKASFLFLLLIAGPCLAQTTFVVKLPDGKPAIGVIVFHGQQEVARTNEKGEAKVAAKITKGEMIECLYGDTYYAKYIVEKNPDKPARIHIVLEYIEDLAKPARHTQSPDEGGDDDWKKGYYRSAQPPVVETAAETEEAQIFSETSAYFPGGHSAMNAFLAKNLKYPEAAREKSVEGKCILEFAVDKAGLICDIKVLYGVANCPECNQEAIRLIGTMPKWIPAKLNGEAINSTTVHTIEFKLP